MKFRNLIVKNIFRNKFRSILAVIGIAIGVAAVVGFGLVTDNLSSSTQNALTAGAADFSVINGTNGEEGGPTAGGNDQLINQTTIGEVQQISGVSNTAGVLQTMINLNASNTNTNADNSRTGISDGNFRSMTTLIGINNDSISMENLEITNGTLFSNSNEVIMGQNAAQSLNKKIGDTISISNQTFKIVGIYETGNFQEDRGIVLSLSELQNITGKTGQVSLILVKATNGTDANTLAKTIQQNYPGLTTSTSLSGHDRMSNGLEIINSGAWAVSLLAILVGGIVVIITMMKAVGERTREIGVLRAIGWTQKRVLAMIIGESLVISFIAIIVGLAVGIGVVELISTTHLMRGIVPSFSTLLLLKGVGVALFLGIVGGLYPAYRASRLSPTEALRYE
jgi:putative ABC transport system permease protein